ncbi:MAG: DUF420 domain-containing protein [Fidelibacterota bacterium]
MWLRVIFIASAVISLAVAFLILGPRPEGIEESVDVSSLPGINAILNGITTGLLVTAYFLIRQKKVNYHRNVMLTAFGTSALFLTSYLIYHWYKSGPTPYVGTWPAFYYTILVTHIILAAAILPLALITLYRGWNLQVTRHRKIARVTLPLWLYVSVTGVIVYALLYR